MLASLKGKKTYILAGLGGLVTVAFMLGWINRDTYEALLGFLGFGTAASLRAGIRKAEEAL